MKKFCKILDFIKLYMLSFLWVKFMIFLEWCDYGDFEIKVVFRLKYDWKVNRNKFE